MLAKVAGKYTLAILDTAGADTTHAAMGAADLCLVPLRPTRPDALGIKPTVEALIRGHKQFAFVLNQCPAGSRSSRAAEMAAGLGTAGGFSPSRPCACARTIRTLTRPGRAWANSRRTEKRLTKFDSFGPG